MLLIGRDKAVNNSERIYYQNQDDWTESDYNALHRYLSKMVEHSHDAVGSLDGNQRIFELRGLNLDMMTDTTKVLLYCSILSQNPSLIDECSNLKPLESVSPLSSELILCPFKKAGSQIYSKYNVLY